MAERPGSLWLQCLPSLPFYQQQPQQTFLVAVAPRISACGSFREELLLVEAAFSMAASNCFCCLPSWVLPSRTTSGNSLQKVRGWTSSAFSKCALYRAVFRMRAGCHISGGHKWSCSFWLCCDLSVFSCSRPPGSSWPRSGGSILMHLKAQNLEAGGPIIQGRLCLFLIAWSQASDLIFVVLSFLIYKIGRYVFLSHGLLWGLSEKHFGSGTF